MSGNSNAQIRSRTCVVCVTYGDRYHFLERVALAALEGGAGMVLVVNNGSTEQATQAMHRLAGQDSGRIQVLDLSENLGSAGGYSRGLEWAMSGAEWDFVWILDDDNLPAAGSFEILVEHYLALEQSTPRDRLLVLAYRESRINQRRLVAGEPPESVFPRKSSCLGYHICDVPRKIWKKLSPFRKGNGNTAPNRIEVPWCQYGGLFMHNSAVSCNGLPDARLFVYADDTEYTYRFTRCGGRIFLIASSRVEDIDESWYLREKPRIALSMNISSPSDFRVYYAVRNQVYFESRFRCESPFVYWINRALVLTLAWVSAQLARKPKRFHLMLRAMRDGMNERLGKLSSLEPE